MELKSALANFVMAFDVVPLVSPGSEGDYASIKLKGLPDGRAFAPKKEMGRPGLGTSMSDPLSFAGLISCPCPGVFQFTGDMKFRVTLRK